MKNIVLVYTVNLGKNILSYPQSTECHSTFSESYSPIFLDEYLFSYDL